MSKVTVFYLISSNIFLETSYFIPPDKDPPAYYSFDFLNLVTGF